MDRCFDCQPDNSESRLRRACLRLIQMTPCTTRIVGVIAFTLFTIASPRSYAAAASAPGAPEHGEYKSADTPGKFLRASVVGAGDVTGNGIADFFIGQPAYSSPIENRGRVELRDGQTGKLVWARYGESRNSRFGEYLSSIGDIDGDGVVDLVTVRRSMGAPVLTVLSGKTGLTRSEIQDQTESTSGLAICRLADVDGDGVEDFAVRYLRFRGDDELLRKGTLVVYSGATLTELYRVPADLAFPIRTGQFHIGSGKSICRFSDMNADGIPDILVGGYMKELETAILSGRDGKVIRSFTGNPHHFGGGGVHGWAVCSISDVDRDGLDDFAIGSPAARVVVYSSGSGELLYSIYDKTASNIGFGDSLARLADLDGDQVDDLVIGSFSSGRHMGPYHAVIVSGRTGTVLERFHERDPIASADEELGETNSYAFVTASGMGAARVRNPVSEKLIDAWIYFPHTGDVVGVTRFGKEIWRVVIE